MTEKPGSIAHDVSVKRFGVPTRVLENVITVSTVPVRVALLNPRRLMISIANRSTDTIVLGFAPNMTATQGFILAPNGGTATFTVDEDGELVAYDMYAVGLSSGGDVYVIEVIGV